MANRGAQLGVGLVAAAGVAAFALCRQQTGSGLDLECWIGLPAQLMAVPWLSSFVSNVLSYAFLVVPAAFVVHHLRQHPDLTSGPGMLARLGRSFVFGAGKPLPATASSDAPDAVIAPGNNGKPPPPPAPQSAATQAWQMATCVLGLQAAYLVWGLVQEKVMTTEYGVGEDGSPIRFRISEFLVFGNRVLALLTAYLFCVFGSMPHHGLPTYKFSFASMSNIMSSWCQYEALKYVSFPTQVLGKSCKVIPVMLMGRLVQGKRYAWPEYAVALGITAGVGMFMLAKNASRVESDESSTSLAGLVLMVGYMAFDSFTSNYQSMLFKQSSMSPYQMMFGVNLFSCIFTLWSLIKQGLLVESMAFVVQYPVFLLHLVLLSFCSAVGQVFIFRTLSLYGALVFAVVMTTRQVLSIVLSAMFYGHSFSLMGWVGVAIVFAALFYKIFHSSQSKRKGAAE